MFSFLSRKKEEENEMPKTAQECRENFQSQEFDIDKMMQPSDKVHDYGPDDLMLHITSTYENLLKLSEMMDKVLDHTTHLPNFRKQCMTFIDMGFQIDDLTYVAIGNLKAKKKIRSNKDFITISDRVKESLNKLKEEIGNTKDENMKSVHLYNELSSDSFKLTDAELKKIQQQAEEEKNLIGGEDPFGEDADDPENLDPQSKKKKDEQIMSRCDELVKNTDKIVEKTNPRDEKLLKKLKSGKLDI